MAQMMAPCLDAVVGAGVWQYVIIDNGSRDRSPQIIEEIKSRWKLTKGISLPRPDYGNALYHGLCHADGVFAWIVNIDFWDPLFLKWSWCYRESYDLIIGSKRADPFLNQQPRYRRILSWGLNSILHVLFGFFGTDTHGQKLLNRRTMEPIWDKCVMRRGQFDTEFTIKAQRSGMRMAEVPVPITETRKQRNLMIAKIYRNLVDISRLRREIRKVPLSHSIHYHMWSRKDMEDLSNPLDGKLPGTTGVC